MTLLQKFSIEEWKTISTFLSKSIAYALEGFNVGPKRSWLIL